MTIVRDVLIILGIAMIIAGICVICRKRRLSLSAIAFILAAVSFVLAYIVIPNVPETKRAGDGSADQEAATVMTDEIDVVSAWDIPGSSYDEDVTRY